MALAIIPALYCVTYLVLHSCGFYHAYYNDYTYPDFYPGGWQVRDETGIAIVDVAFRPAIIVERTIRNYLE